MMKKVFFAFAIAGMFGFAACGSNNTETVDTMAEQAVEAAATEMTEETSRVTAMAERLKISFARMESRLERADLRIFRTDITKFLQE